MRRSSPALLSAFAARSGVTGRWPLHDVYFFEKQRCSTCTDSGEGRDFSNKMWAGPHDLSRRNPDSSRKRYFWSTLAASADILASSSPNHRRLSLLFKSGGREELRVFSDVFSPSLHDLYMWEKATFSKKKKKKCDRKQVGDEILLQAHAKHPQTNGPADTWEDSSDAMKTMLRSV